MVCQKDKATSDREKNKPTALAIIELCLTMSEGIRQAVGQSVENSIEYTLEKLCSYILEYLGLY